MYVYRRLLVVIGGLLCSLAACDVSMSSTETHTNRTRGEVIVQAIDQYVHDKHHLPDQLDLLVPKYLAELPETTREQAFLYRNNIRTEGYELCFTVSQRRSCCYISRYPVWDCTGSHP